MAGKRKKKKASLGNVLKYEIYGIILITLSIIALAGEAAVGHALFKMSAMIFGKFYFVIPLTGIYVGLTVMIHRKWPSKWSSRRTGMVMIVCAFALMSTISAMQYKLAPVLPLTPRNVLLQIHHDLQFALTKVGSTGVASMFNLDISGGYVGALEFILFYVLFGLTGAKLMMLVMFAISFMLITNLSYVELFSILKNRTGKLAVQLSRKYRLLRPSPAVAEGKTGTKSKGIKINSIPEADDYEDEDLEESLPAPEKARTKPVFFQLLGFKDKSESAEQAISSADEREDESADVNWNDVELHTISDAEPQRNEPSLIIRDFFDQIQREDRTYDEKDDSGQHPDEESPVSFVSPGSVDPVNAAAVDSSGVTLEGESGLGQDELTGTLPVLPPKPAPKPYRLPSFKLLSKGSSGAKAGDQADYMQTARKLEATLESFGVRAKVLEVVRGPAVTRYEIQPDIGVKVSRIVNLTDDIALALAAKDIRMEAPIPGKSAIGIEVPNSEVSVVTMREVMETPTFQDAESKLSIAFGRDISGQTIVGNLAKMPHLLVAGATGSGKSVCINGIITSILYKAKPDEVKFLMVDPKMVELNMYNGIPHLLAPVVTDPRRASLALKKIVVEMEKRYEMFSKSGARNVEGYNNMMKENPAAILPYIVVIVDELADLMMVAANDVEDAIARLAQMARAAGIHLIIATQRPSVDVITGVIKANIPSRIAFGVSSQVDSRTILDMAGAEKLLGRGDMLFMPMGASKPVRVQGAFMSDQEVESIVDYVRGQAQAEYDETLIPEIDDTAGEPEEQLDELYDQAVQIVLEAKQASVSLLQRRMRVGYTRAARLIDSMEARGIVGPYEGSKPREVLTSMEQYRQNRVSS
ncbi:DNA translocase FtsK [Paenibacillus zeisoli]|uniref:DNA translocase FtsK n=1 Tax=Paenibacillus zeisoli TaxID=2496267 RepID=A0A433X6V7_9BACL|nr:DNA translocase FtsK [Paenibacillus zeisoli]RUT29772.1 DNA translocase FtsK [Paenibacillus zeisoli]